MKKFKLGQKLRDKVTGFEGIATARVEYLNGCVQYAITPALKEKNKNNSYPDAVYLDIQQLEKAKDKISISKHSTGGVMRDTPSSRYKS